MQSLTTTPMYWTHDTKMDLFLLGAENRVWWSQAALGGWEEDCMPLGGRCLCSSERLRREALIYIIWRRKGNVGAFQRPVFIISILVTEKLSTGEVKPVAQGHPAVCSPSHMFSFLMSEEGHSLGIVPSIHPWKGTWWESLLPGSCLHFEQLRMLDKSDLLSHFFHIGWGSSWKQLKSVCYFWLLLSRIA